MIRKLVRVILSAEVGGFIGNIGRAGRAFSKFAGSIIGGLGRISFTELNQGLELVRKALRGVQQAAKFMFDTFLKGALDIDRGRAALNFITQDAAATEKIMAGLTENQEKYGTSVEASLPAAVQLAQALRAMDGAVDPSKVLRLNDILASFSAIRPDVPIDKAARALTGLLSGNLTSFRQVFDIDPKMIEGLSENAQALLNAAGEAKEESLGAVTRLGDEAGGFTGDALSAAEEILEAVGISKGILDEIAETPAGKMAILEGRFASLRQEIGEELLPVFEELVDVLIKFFDENEEEIDAFVKAFGEFSAEEWEKFAKVLAEIDWELIAQTISDITSFLAGEKTIGDPNAPFIKLLNNLAGAGGPSGAGGQAGESTRGFFQNLFGGGRQDATEAGPVRASEFHQQEVKVTVAVDVDSSGNIIPIVTQVSQDISESAIGEFTDSILSPVGNKKGGSTKQPGKKAPPKTSDQPGF